MLSSPDLAKYSLGDLIGHFGLQETLKDLHPARQWHDALYDATASALLLEHLIKSLNISNLSLDLLLHPDLTAWRALRPT